MEKVQLVLRVMVYECICEIGHQILTSFGDVVEGNLHNEQEMLVM
jgi:hypothetical protein